MTRFDMSLEDAISILSILATAFIVSLILTWMLIPFLSGFNVRQTAREEGPASHIKKSGTPTMGGAAIILGVVFAYAAFNYISEEAAVVLTAFVAFGALGFCDDYVKVKNKRNLGLTARWKIASQVLLAAGLAWYQSGVSEYGTRVKIPFITEPVDFHMFYIPFITIFIVAVVNSVNLTDGLDGLASGVTVIVSFFFAATGAGAGAAFCAALAGGCLGFLPFNRNPAKIFMGDTGSLALGGGLAAAAVVMNMELIMPVAGGIYAAEAFSVIVQVASYKLRGGKRVFLMAPLHHHFECRGWPERKVTGVFCCVAAALCALSFFLL
ncbi:MAG: phospho-N-acetylmuramoyl-pentapeptide-transferase [Clostridiales Family XIII bacterium]|jgi:phospho-N-acetylmuramoyl-pentapeptide-transferase|nr:phospho-N-acetylmuramoyl-pentapeptide-transferase [Clostridiales Family XIII bacterium]